MKIIFNTEPQILQKTLSSNQMSILVTGFHLFWSFFLDFVILYVLVSAWFLFKPIQ
jgi:hypothetical protein